MHGAQSLRPELATTPMTYYLAQSGIGRALAQMESNARIGVVGLGTGTLVCHAKPGQHWTAWEIDPLIVTIARRDFSYISRCKPDLAVVIGDARLTLAQAPPAALDLLAIDAFSSDAIPLHLITAEAFGLYGRALARDGLLLVHISNRFLDLEPVLAALAASGGWQVQVLALPAPRRAATGRAGPPPDRSGWRCPAIPPGLMRWWRPAAAGFHPATNRGWRRGAMISPRCCPSCAGAVIEGAIDGRCTG